VLVPGGVSGREGMMRQMEEEEERETGSESAAGSAGSEGGRWKEEKALASLLISAVAFSTASPSASFSSQPPPRWLTLGLG